MHTSCSQAPSTHPSAALLSFHRRKAANDRSGETVGSADVSAVVGVERRASPFFAQRLCVWSAPQNHRLQ